MADIITQLKDLIIDIVSIIVIVGAGYLVGVVAGIVVRLFSAKLLESYAKTSGAGKRLQEAGVPEVLELLTVAFAVSLAFLAAVDYVDLGGDIGAVLYSVASYLPRVIVGVAVLFLGILLSAGFSSALGNVLAGMLPKKRREVAELGKGLILVGLVTLVVSVSLGIMGFASDYVYSLILGLAIMAMGVIAGSMLVDSIAEDNPEFKEFAGYAKFLIYLIFIMIGLAAIFTQYPGASRVITTLSWGVALAMAILLLPLVYTLTKRLVGETARRRS